MNFVCQKTRRGRERSATTHCGVSWSLPSASQTSSAVVADGIKVDAAGDVNEDEGQSGGVSEVAGADLRLILSGSSDDETEPDGGLGGGGGIG